MYNKRGAATAGCGGGVLVSLLVRKLAKPVWPNRIRLLRMSLSPPAAPHCAAVAFGFRPENVCLKGTSTPQSSVTTYVRSQAHGTPASRRQSPENADIMSTNRQSRKVLQLPQLKFFHFFLDRLILFAVKTSTSVKKDVAKPRPALPGESRRH